jgi:hypothetical protein
MKEIIKFVIYLISIFFFVFFFCFVFFGVLGITLASLIRMTFLLQLIKIDEVLL